MAVTDVVDSNGERVSQIDLPDGIFDVPIEQNVIHEVVKMQLAGRRAGSAAVKHRSDVKGSGRKVFRQKGRGAARHGDLKGPQQRGGGSAFGPDPKSYGYRVPKRVRSAALKMALTSKLREKELLLLNALDLEAIKTKQFLRVMDALDVTSGLIVTDKRDAKLELSSRNVPGIKVLQSQGLNVLDILKYKNLVLLASSLKEIEGRLLR